MAIVRWLLRFGQGVWGIARRIPRVVMAIVRWLLRFGRGIWGIARRIPRVVVAGTYIASIYILWLVDFLFLRLLLGYGLSVTRIMFAWVLIISSYAGVFAMSPNLLLSSDAGAGLWTIDTWVSAFYDSAMVFVTIGLGSASPVRLLGKVVVASEALVGAFMIAFTVTVAAQRFTRLGR